MKKAVNSGLILLSIGALLLSGCGLRQCLHTTMGCEPDRIERDRKSTRLNSSHLGISYAVFCSGDPRDLHSFPTRRSSDLSALVPFSFPDVGCGNASTPRWGANRIALRERNRVRSSAVRPQDAISTKPGAYLAEQAIP